ncbi:MAG: gliding motility-associated C-terminal domain-containing protein [Bacteroidetes bacterium]|nr:gliding motility-associated C-terminal domain-containing protein [Bacteroidota bacterium]
MFIVSLNQILGIDKPVHITGVCLNKSDSTATIKWIPFADSCGSFVSYQIYGRDEPSSLYEFVASENILNQSTATIKLKNNKEWEFFIVTRYACNGTDSLVSDTVKVDVEQPVEWELDSVSVDLITQKTIMGWKPHPAKDSKGFFVYYMDNNNVLLTDTFGHFFMDSLYGNPEKQSEKYALATYDSCGNTSPISNGLNTIFLNGSFDTCGRVISLQWSHYHGVNVKNYLIKVSPDSFINYQIEATLNANTDSFKIENLESGRRYCVLIQMISDSGVTSTSNRICFETPIPTGAINNIYKVSVTESQQIQIDFMSKLKTGTINLLKSSDNTHFSIYKSYEAKDFPGSISIIDTAVEVNSTIYYYQITHKDECGYVIPQDSSPISNSILLNVEEKSIESELTWNSYSTFAKTTGQYQVHKQYGLKIFPRGTWNLIDVLNPNQTTSFDVYQHQEYAYKLCYVVSAIENDINVFGRQDTAFSNSFCFIRDLAIYFPNAFAPRGINTTFGPVGIGIIEENNASILQVYNRWGEKIFETHNVLKGWDGRDSAGEFCQSGTYIYFAKIKGELGEAVEFKGTFYLID